MPTPTAVAQRLYDAMAHADGPALFGLLTEDFVGTVSTGMPHGVGGEHHGAVDMITGVWARIASIYDVHVDPLDYLQVDDDRVVVLGRYWGAARDGGSAATGEEPESVVEAARDLRNRKDPDPRCRELERQRDTVQAAADPNNVVGVFLAEGEGWLTGVATVDEQADRLVVSKFIQRRHGVAGGNAK